MEEIVLELHKIRGKYLRHRLTGLALALMGIAFIFWGLKWYIWLITLFIGIGIWGGSSEHKTTYVLTYKCKLIKAILQTHFQDVHFEVEKGIFKKDIDCGRLRHYGTKYFTDHKLQAKYKGVSFIYAPIRFVEEKVNKKGKLLEKELFHGKWLTIKMHKAFSGEIQIHKEPTIKYKKYLSKVEFEDIVFNKSFKTFASTPHEAFFLITPKVMENISALDKQSCHSIFNFDLCFENGRLYALINDSNNYYDVSILRKINLVKVEKKIALGVEEVKKYIDLLHVDTWGV